MSPAPYPVTRSKTSSDFCFVTDSGVTYNVYFDTNTPILPNDDLDRYSIFMGFSCIPPNGNGFDARVEPTIILIIANMLKSNKKYIITYFCSSQNKQERGRAILFERWYKRSPLTEKIAHKQKRNANNYFGALYCKKHREIESIEATFVEFDLIKKYPDEIDASEELGSRVEENYDDFIYS